MAVYGWKIMVKDWAPLTKTHKQIRYIYIHMCVCIDGGFWRENRP